MHVRQLVELQAYLTRIIFQGIIELILSTDMSRHSDILEDFRNALEQGMDFENKQHRSLVSSRKLGSVVRLQNGSKCVHSSVNFHFAI